MTYEADSVRNVFKYHTHAHRRNEIHSTHKALRHLMPQLNSITYTLTRDKQIHILDQSSCAFLHNKQTSYTSYLLPIHSSLQTPAHTEEGKYQNEMSKIKHTADICSVVPLLQFPYETKTAAVALVLH